MKSFLRSGGCSRAALAVLVVAASSSLARAESVVFESWVGGASPQESQRVAGLRDALGQAGLLAMPAAITQVLGARAPLPALDQAGSIDDEEIKKRLATARADLEEAISQYRGRRFQVAEKLLSQLVANAQKNPLLFANEAGRPALRQAMVYLALSRNKLRQSAAAATASEDLVRTFPGEREKVFGSFGPVADTLYRAAESRLSAQGHGTLIVEVNDPDAVVVVNEGAANSRAFEKTVLPGSYRVLVKTSLQGARRYEVSVRANETTRLTIDWQVDRSLVLSPDSAAIVFDSHLERAFEGAVAVSLARALAAGPYVTLLGSRIVDGYPAVSASLYEVVTGRHVGTALAVMDGQSEKAKLASIKTFVVSSGRSVNSNIYVSATALDTVADLQPEAPPPSSPSRWPAYLAGSGALISFATGIALVEIDDDLGRYGYASFGASAALLGYAAYRWSEISGAEHRRPPARSAFSAAVSARPRGAVAWAGWTF